MPSLARAIELRQGNTAITRAVAALGSPLGILALAATAASIGVVVIGTGGVVTNADGFAALLLWTVVTMVAAGLYFQDWRPANPLGRLLVLDGFLIALHAFQATPQPVLFSIGLLAEVPSTLLLFYILLAYPLGRLERPGRIAIATVSAFFAVAYLPRLFLVDPVQGGSPLAACGSTCPDNPLLLYHGQNVLDFMHYFVPLSRLVAVGAVAAALALRLVRATRPRRRMLLPVATLGLTWLSLLAVYGTAQAFADGSAVTSNLGFGVVMARAMLPAAFLLAPLQARAFAGLSLQRMLRRFEPSPTLLVRERVIARTLDDARLHVAFWLAQSHRYVDATGVEVDRPEPASGLVWTPVRRGTEPFAALIHDERLLDEPELVQAAAHALLISVSNARIEVDLERSVDDLRRSRRLLLEADAADRRRLERDLHSTAQQHLVALRVSLELARERAAANTALAERLASLGGELDHAVDDLRRIAAELYSPILDEAGLAPALRDMARRTQRPLVLELEEVGRLPADVERCMYLCVLEAVSNALTHAGPGATARVRLERERDGVGFTVGDDGVGFDVDATPGNGGLQGIVERLAAVGGTGRVVSVPGLGTVVSGRVPVERSPT